jgi:hypothetical protein
VEELVFYWKASLGNQVSGADFFQIMDKDFKWPQVWRTSLGIDHKFENNYIATLDMFTIKISMVFTCKIGD